MNSLDSVVIVGGGLAGANAAFELRKLDFAGRVTLIGEEDLPPYERPPLSKEYLRGEKPVESTYVRPLAEYEASGIELLRGRRAVTLDAPTRRVNLDDGTTLGYDALLIATGAAPRGLGSTRAFVEGVRYLRTADDADALRAAAMDASSIAVIGGGWISEDGFREFSQYFAYIAPTFGGAIAGTEGALRVWVPDRRVRDGNPSANDLDKGETMRGHFKRIPNARDLLPLQLEKLVQSMGAFDFNRIEDSIDDPNAPGTVYFAETGRANQEVTHGRVYRLVVDPADPTAATLTPILAADAGDDIFNPDNLGISDTTLMIQEDHNWKAIGYNRIHTYDLATGAFATVARTDPDQAIIDDRGPGSWESSGIVSVADIFGEGWWLANVQAHYTEVNVPDQTLEPDSATGEGGQMTLLFVPGT
jgi:hypothetical protein